MECEHCGTSYEEGDKFLFNVWKKDRQCMPHCGTKNEKDARYCKYCGYSLLKES